MSLIVARRLRDKFWPEPLPPSSSFEGKTVLVTGATTGLGLGAAVHFATLGARVIITSRSRAQGTAAIHHIERRADIIGQGKVQALELDMNRYPSCVSLIGQLRESEFCRAGLDVAVLNAGILNVDFVQSPEGWEQTIQVNTLSTTLVGLLLLQFMRQASKDVAKGKPHLVFVTSRDHLDPDIGTWAAWSEHESHLHHFSDRRNWPTGQIDPNYAVSKLMLTYAVEQICKKATAFDGSVDIIVNTVCPGLVYSDLGRSIAKSSKLMQVLVPVHASLMGKSVDYGARFYVKAARTSESEHGKYIQSLLTDEEYRSLAIPNLKSDVAMTVKAIVWDEIIAELRGRVPVLEEVMKSLGGLE